MEERTLCYFVSDVHLGLDVKDPEGRERRFVDFLRSIPASRTRTLYMLGDIWDFWYEYKDVVPKGYVAVFAALEDLMSAGVEVCFFPGNHDIWCYHYFESLGIRVLSQPYVTEISGKTFCLGHGDGLGPGMYGYKAMRWVFHNKVFQWLFSLVHPRIAFWLGTTWSRNSRLARNVKYQFKGEREPLYKYADAFGKERNVDYFIFGHYHTPVDMEMPSGARLLLLDDWMDKSGYLYFNGISVLGGHSPNTEK